jgi:hypothetical protein
MDLFRPSLEQTARLAEADADAGGVRIAAFGSQRGAHGRSHASRRRLAAHAGGLDWTHRTIDVWTFEGAIRARMVSLEHTED